MTRPVSVNEQGRAALLGWQRTVDAAWQQVDLMAGTLAPASGKVLGQPGGRAEYRRIQNFIHDEMVNNSRSRIVTILKALNRRLVTKPQAYLLWASQVRPGGPWDHKERILDMTAGNNTFTPIPGGDGKIRYDFWSNLHYGYVGIEAGFTASELRGGAAAADVATQDRTDRGDDLAVRMGIELRDRVSPAGLQPQHIEQAIRRHLAELRQTGMVIR